MPYSNFSGAFPAQKARCRAETLDSGRKFKNEATAAHAGLALVSIAMA